MRADKSSTARDYNRYVITREVDVILCPNDIIDLFTLIRFRSSRTAPICRFTICTIAYNTCADFMTSYTCGTIRTAAIRKYTDGVWQYVIKTINESGCQFSVVEMEFGPPGA